MSYETELWSAAKRGDVSVFEQDKFQEDPSLVTGLRNEEGDSLGHIAARKGHLEFIKKLLNLGLEVNLPNKKGKTLVHEATQNSQISILKFLRSHGADFSLMMTNGDSVLDIAKKPEVVNYLESILYSTPSASSASKSNKKKTKGSRHLSDLKEVKKSGGVVPTTDPIHRVHTIWKSTNSSLSYPLCQLEEVGWSVEEAASLGFPRRPDWRGLGLFTAESLHSHEEKEFEEWLGKVEGVSKVRSVSCFERNIEYWRELWRVLERGDLCLIMADARNPLLHLNSSFLAYLTTELKLKTIVCLNKSDLVEDEVVCAWKEYLEKQLGVEVVHSSCKDEGQSREQLMECILHQTVVCSESQETLLIQDSISLTVQELLNYRQIQNKPKKTGRKQKHKTTESSCSSSEEEMEVESGRKQPIVVSVIGEPNVGKSSVLNYLLGRKKVGVSSHPGRTKHLQTHLLCPGLMLCDCPGIVFPKINVPFPMQVLFGCFPIARCQDVYSVVGYLASQIHPPLPQILALEDKVESGEWSVLEICESLAKKHNWMTHRGGRLDVYRSANTILRNALAGREEVVLRYWPPSLV